MDGVVVRNSSGRRLEELLWEWISVVERTVRRWPDDDDAAWMYNERASISIFGGAVWRMGGVVFEEFVTDKPNRPAQVLKPGRADIFFEYCGRDYILEAKQCAPLITSSVSFKVLAALEAAKSDIRACNPYTYTPMAMVFAAPKLAKGLSAQRDSLISHWVRDLNTLRPAALAWTFPRPRRRKKREAISAWRGDPDHRRDRARVGPPPFGPPLVP
jgi:hypothetical protein